MRGLWGIEEHHENHFVKVLTFMTRADFSHPVTRSRGFAAISYAYTPIGHR